MSLSKKYCLTSVIILSLSLLIVSAHANRTRRHESSMGIEIALKKPFYIPAATSGRGMSAVIKTPLAEGGAEHGMVSAVKLVATMEGDKVKVTVTALIGDTTGIITCRDWDSLKSIKIDTYVAGLDEEVSISKLRDYGVKFETGDLKFRVVPKKIFPQIPSGGACGCATCGPLQCCPNPGYCIGCGACGSACCYSNMS